jgi:ubiquinone/menaquinone biosynthesis C-methylase UbiE
MENFFDSAAQDWDKNQLHIKRSEAIAKELREIIVFQENSKALEYGAGTGLLSFAIKDLFSEITLMDSSLEMVRVTTEKLEKEDIQNLFPVFFDLEKENYELKSFDFIFTQMTLHHVSNIHEIFSKFYKLLNKGGQIAIVDLYKEDGTFHDRDFTGHSGFNPEDLEVILSKIGFVDINFKQCFEITKVDGPDKGKVYPLFLLSCNKL